MSFGDYEPDLDYDLDAEEARLDDRWRRQQEAKRIAAVSSRHEPPEYFEEPDDDRGARSRMPCDRASGCDRARFAEPPAEGET